MNSSVLIKQVLLINLLTLVVIASVFMVYRVVASPDNSLKSALSSPEVLSYQGSLMDSEGLPVSGTKDIVIRIYNNPTVLTPLWEESHSGPNAVEVQLGLFDVLLGSLVPIPEEVWNESELYLGIQVGGDLEMAPREIINLMPLQIVSNSLDASVLKMTPWALDLFTRINFLTATSFPFKTEELGNRLISIRNPAR